MKRIISVLMAALLVFSLSLPAYAATADDLANKLYSGWSDTSTPLTGSWYALIKQYFSHLNYKIDLWLPYLKNLGSSTDGDNAYTLVGTSKFLHNILGNNLNGTISNQLYNIRTLLTTISNSNSAWTSSQASTITDNTSLINSVLSSISDNLIYLEPIYNNSVTIDSYTSSLLTNSNDLKTGWFLYPQLQRPNAKAGYQNSWYFGVLQSLYNFRSDFSISNMTKGRVEGFTDSDFSHLTFSEGIYSMLYRMQQVLADDDDLQMRQDSEENKNVAKDSFLSYDSDTSVKPDDIGGLSNLGSGLRNNFDTGTVEASNLFDFWGSDNTFSWFTQETKDNMVNVSSSGSGARRARAQNDEPIYYSPYGEHMEEYERLMREGIK